MATYTVKPNQNLFVLLCTYMAVLKVYLTF